MLDVDESQLAADPRSGGEDTRDADDTQLNWLTSAWAEPVSYTHLTLPTNREV